ncbi:MAG: radical SAM protein [Desulfobacteraceae bacterium]|nr:radical SAM protein [Desulfobacteraceae bacterium]
MEAPHILCVNPWIHDYAAFDFWAKPLGLLGLAAILRDNGVRVSYMDCLDRFHPRAGDRVKVQADGRGPYRKTVIPPPKGLETTGRRYFRYGIDPEWFRQDLLAMDRPDLVFVTSLMTYWAPGVRETIAVIKEVFPDIPVVLGGIYATLCTDHARTCSLADEVAPGNGEEKLPELVQRYTGFPFAPKGNPGNLDTQPYPALDLVSHLCYAPILTSRGCPFSCEYCASSFLEPGFRRRSPESVFREICHWHREKGIRNFAFYDDALLIHGERYAIPLFEAIIDAGLDLDFHTPNAVHIREITQPMATLMFKAGFKSIRLGLETTDFSSARTHDSKVKANEFHMAVRRLLEAGFDHDQIGAYLLCGLPGQEVAEVKSSMVEVEKSGITPVLAYYTPIPHTEMWEEAKSASRYDLDKDPVFTNNALFPCMERDIPSIKTISQLKKISK